MYIPSAFLEEDISALHGIMQSARLAHIVTATTKGLISTPLPMLLMPQEGPLGTLYGHIARANTQWTSSPIGEAMTIFMGPDGYISPSWYPSKQAHHKVVPTWNYIAVHAYGPIEFFEDEGLLRALVSELTDKHEETQPQPWAVTDAPQDFITPMLKGIVGFRLPISRLDGKRKMSQNRDVADRQGAAAGLSRSPLESDRVAAESIPL